MSNEFVVFVAILVAALGAGCATWVIALLKQNEYLRAEVQFLGEEYNKVAEDRDLAKENVIRNANIARRAFIREGELEEKVKFLENSAANGWKDAADKWQQLVELRNK